MSLPQSRTAVLLKSNIALQSQPASDNCAFCFAVPFGRTFIIAFGRIFSATLALASSVAASSKLSGGKSLLQAASSFTIYSKLHSNNCKKEAKTQKHKIKSVRERNINKSLQTYFVIKKIVHLCGKVQCATKVHLVQKY